MSYDDEPPEDPYDNTPPPHQNPDAERAVLGALLLDPHLADQLAQEVTRTDFYHPKHETIWDACHTIHADPDRKLDPLTLSDHLARTGQLQRIGGAPYLHDLMQACPLPSNATYYAHQVRDAARLRAVADTATRLRRLADKADPTLIDSALADALQELDTAAARFGPTTPGDGTGLADLSWILSGQAPEVPPPLWCRRSDGHALFYAAKVNGIFGDPECGKTWLAQTAIVEALTGGGTAAMIDVDHNGPDHTAARLLLLGAHINHLADPDRFRYYEPEDAEQLHACVTDITNRHPDIVLIDSLGEIFPMLGTNTNDGDEITTAMRQVCTRPAVAGSCVITIDHLPKSAEARQTGYAIGSIAKKRMIRGAYIRAEARQQPVPGQVGRITLRIEKDTAGELRKSSGGGYAGTFVLDSTQPHMTTWAISKEEMPKNDDGTFRPTALMERVSRFIEDNDQATFTDIKEAITAKDKWLRDAIQMLVTEGFVARLDGARRAKLHHCIAPYREAEDDHVQ